MCFDDCPDDNNDSFRYGFGAGCALSWFDGFVSDYIFTGQWIRTFNTSSGPFATGTYQTSGGESGSFEFYEEGRTP